MRIEGRPASRDSMWLCTQVVGLVLVELIVPIESLTTKSTFWMTPKSTLINGSWVVVPEFLMPSKLSKCEKLMLVSEDLLVAST